MEEALSSTRIRISFLLTFLLTYLFFSLCLLSTVDCQLSSVLSLQNKIRERGEGARKLGIGAAVEACLGALRIILRKRAGTAERAGFVNERNNGFGPDGNKFFFREHARDQLARVAVTIFHRVDQRQRDFAFFQIAEDRVSK